MKTLDKNYCRQCGGSRLQHTSIFGMREMDMWHDFTPSDNLEYLEYMSKKALDK